MERIQERVGIVVLFFFFFFPFRRISIDPRLFISQLVFFFLLARSSFFECHLRRKLKNRSHNYRFVFLSDELSEFGGPFD